MGWGIYKNKKVMIYFVSPDIYPKEGQYIEEHKYEDENGFVWLIARVGNGFMVKYSGDRYFMENEFCIEISDTKVARIKNTGCAFIQDASFDTFFHFRNLLKNGYTDEIWDAFEVFLKDRLARNPGRIESEII